MTTNTNNTNNATGTNTTGDQTHVPLVPLTQPKQMLDDKSATTTTSATAPNPNRNPNPSLNPNPNPNPKRVGVLGTGQYAFAFARRLMTAGYSVTLGSRHQQERQERLQQQRLVTRRDSPESAWGDVIRVTSLEDCVTGNDIIVVALHAEHFRSVFARDPTGSGSGLGSLCAGKILVDVSNRTDGSCRRVPKGAVGDEGRSNADLLQSLVPEAAVVKAFNSVSAYAMENDVTAGGARVVAVAGDDAAARAAVCALARDLGFESRENGGLRKAWRMEEAELSVLPEWRVAGVVTLLFLVFWFLLAVGRFYLAEKKLEWDQLPLKLLNKVFGATTLSLLALTYFPSTLAAVLQMAYGSKYRRFPDWLDGWLKARKQLGLIAFGVISLHVTISAVITSPTYMSSWFHKADILVEIPANLTQDLDVRGSLGGTQWMTWIGELSILVGILAFALMSLLAVTSLPSVTNSLNWAEWRLVHSRLGYVMLTLAVTHVYVMGVEKWVKTGFPLLFFRVRFMSIVLPTIVLACRLLLLLPCFSTYLGRIRRGWERKPAAASREEQ